MKTQQAHSSIQENTVDAYEQNEKQNWRRTRRSDGTQHNTGRKSASTLCFGQSYDMMMHSKALGDGLCHTVQHSGVHCAM